MIALRILVVAIVLSGTLGKMIYDRVIILREGEIIVLETEPVDPRSLFRGDYVVLDYDINRLDLTRLEGDNEFEIGEPAYVALTKQESFWQASSVHNEPPTVTGPDDVIIKGRVRRLVPMTRPCPSDEPACETDAARRMSRMLHIDYGIGSYFVPEGEGRRIEDAIRDPTDGVPVEIEVAVGDDGTAAIKALLLDGERLYDEPLY